MTTIVSWVIRCEVSGGVTGTRTALLKNGYGKVYYFDSEEEAKGVCDGLYERLGQKRTAKFKYTPEPVTA